MSDIDEIASRENSIENANFEEVEGNIENEGNINDKFHNRSTQKGMQTLQSQQQRLQREAQFSIPYHKPKKYTLQEFLSRRNIVKPSGIINEKYSPGAFGKSRNLKMTREELAIYSQLMEDRAKEASEFFRPENTDNSNKTEDGNGDNNNLIKSAHENSLTSVQKEFKEPETTDINESEKCRDKNVIITEILELPKLDLKDVAKDLNLKTIVNQPVLSKEKTAFSLSSNACISGIFKESPTLKDDVDISFDFLSNGKDVPKSISGANSLLERLMKTNPCQKPVRESIGLLSPKCNSKALLNGTDVCLSKKPGETFLKLKDNLKSIIMEKRREEMKKRQEEDNAKNTFGDTDEDGIDVSTELYDKLLPASSENSESESDFELENNGNDDKELSIYQSQNTQVEPEKEEDEVDIKRRIVFLSDDSDESQQLSPPAISQVPETQICNLEEETDKIINLCSGTFETQPVVPNEDTTDNKIISSNEENSPLSDCKRIRTKRYTKKIKKSKMKLGFSDDEAEESDDEAGESGEAMGADSSPKNDNLPATYIDYDSEENEITVELTKQDCLKQAETFFEKEAELSESDWGSADEDEKNLDQYDIELGDEDEFDKEEVRAELGKIHARKMLDDDIRQVNKLQEILLEDEEDDSARRQRKFRWKNFDTAFNLEIDQNQLTDTKPEEGSDDENEHLWRKIRFEREQTIKNQSLNETSLDATVSVATPKASDIKNLTIVTASKSKIEESEEKEKSQFLISKELIKVEGAKARSSFLLRNKKALTKTICSVKNGSNDVNTSPDKIGVKTINTNKFVFTTLSFEEKQTLKRKAGDINDDIDMNILKRSKSEKRKSEYLIDKLL
ncbi:claspin isoform X1 [Anastrepha ludens]|uniref:claspin isoform X1 n=2 Tax=Anastrepha ludens TaxID=28586 RepID=UPI0023AF4D75|nr:claspin isoform X1 [Anastrepha ludens]XP_053957195.1 claspin isoform X1 [Anastrepha ludens]XP_053957199.1 claspin isoform X1 [Anastrepha ludens]